MNKVEKILNEYYNEIDEDSRLIKDKAHFIEYLTTTKYIEEYLHKGNRILEVGAGTGRYSINYASKGYNVDAIELVKKNLEVMKSKITKDMNIKAMQGNCLDLSRYEDNTFDITLVLGPLYHLYEEKEIEQAIKEAVRVTKKKGKIFMAYLTDDSVVMSYGIRKGNLKRLKELCDEDWKIAKIPEEIFATYRVEDFDKMIQKFNVKHLKTIAADGIAQHIQGYINNLSEEEFNIYMDYHFKNCERQDLIGYSSHVLKLVEKI